MLKERRGSVVTDGPLVVESKVSYLKNLHFVTQVIDNRLDPNLYDFDCASKARTSDTT